MITGTSTPRHVTGISLTLVTICINHATAAPIYVDASATGSNNGTNWANAYVDLQDAINQAWNNPSSYPEIRVAQGRYTPDGGSLDRFAVFHLVNAVQIKGGFGGLQATDPDDRDIFRYETILSGDLNGDDVPCDVNTNRDDNSYNIISGYEPDGFTLVDASAVLDGFTITGSLGSAVYLQTDGFVGASPTIRNCKVSYNYSPGGIGAGIWCDERAAPIVQYCTIESNHAKLGSGIFLGRFADARIEDCYFVGNHLADRGGGLYIADRAEPRIERCRFEANASGGGGAIVIAPSFADTRPFISDCQFINNIVDGGGGNGGGAILNSNPYPFSIVNCLFVGNQTSNTGSNGGGGAVLHDFDSTCQMINCAFSRNSTDGQGGALYHRTSSASIQSLINCTFSNNAASSNGGGVRCSSAQGPTQASFAIRNCLFWGNKSSDSPTLAKQISTTGPTPTVSYSSIQGCSGCFGGNNNNGSEPAFVSAGRDNLRLKSTSPAIDAADNCQIPGSVSTDLDGTGHNRRIDDTTTDTGNDACNNPATTTYLDRGAYEFNRSLDCNSNGRNDNDDIACGGGNTCIGTAGSYDCNRDGIPDDCVSPCLKGDVNHDGLTDGQDVQALVNRLLGPSACAVADCEADVNSDSLITLADIPCFTNILLGFTDCAYTCSATLDNVWSVDCNGNEINDANDIADGTSQDCNANFIPDECDIDPEDPDGDELVSNDLNSNDIPDECEKDCNDNGRPDDADIACGGGNTCGGIAGSYDVNVSGVPDECESDCNANNLPDDYDIAQQTSADCNANGFPDECEADCNANNVPDDCDIDPQDPDGDQVVHADCNANGVPDACDLTRGPPLGSLDCNENNVPDECDIASQTSADANENGIPDECEEENRANSGENGDLTGSFTDDAPVSATGPLPDGRGSENARGTGDSTTDDNNSDLRGTFDEDAAWAELYDWAAAQCWGPDCATTPREQFDAYVAKLTELGLPVSGPR